MSNDTPPKKVSFMTDAHLSGLAKELRDKGVDCETIHKVMLGHEDSRVKITDPEIVKFLLERQGSIALITMDNELAEYCGKFGIPVVRVQDVVSQYILSNSLPAAQPGM
jgi:uncharacterized protein with PIN domain